MTFKAPQITAVGIVIVCRFVGKWLKIAFGQSSPTIDENDIAAILFLCSWLQVLQKGFVKKRKGENNK